MAVLFLCSGCRKSLSFRGRTPRVLASRRSAPVGIRLPAPAGAELPLPPSAREVSKPNVLTEGETGGCRHPPLRTVSRRFFRRRRCPRSEASTLGVHRPARCTNAFPLLPRRGGRLCPPLHPSIGGKTLFKTQRRVRRIALPSAAFLSQFVFLSAVLAASFCSTMRSGVTPAFSASSFVITTGSAVSSTSLAMIQ